MKPRGRVRGTPACTDPGPAIEALLGARRARRIDRREFMRAAVAIAASGFAPALLRAADAAELPPRFAPVLSAVQAHLFPRTDQAPGAPDINALAYLAGVLADPLVEAREKRFLLAGIGWLEDSAQDRYARSFTALRAGERETLLRSVERSAAGRDWLALVLYYVFEALLTDPVYGGNPQGVGWRWLEHAPGFPRPDSDTRAEALPRA